MAVIPMRAILAQCGNLNCPDLGKYGKLPYFVMPMR